MNKVITTLTSAIVATTIMASGYAKKCNIKYKDYITMYADEDNHQTPQNHLLVIDYKNMKLLDKYVVPGVLNHHADPLGTLDKANYVMMVPKGSNFTTIRSLKDGSFVKKIRLPFRPRSADTYNSKYNLVLLNSRDRPAAVLIDTIKLKIVGKAGFNIKCSQNKPYPLSIDEVYSDKEILDPNYKCTQLDFGGDQISGHPLWVSSEEFVIVDRANRMLHLYKIRKNGDKFDTKLVQTINTISSLHQVIPKDKTNPNNKIFYGMTEGNEGINTVAGVYKFRLVGNKLKKEAFTPLVTYPGVGINGHNLYIDPKHRYLFAPAGKRGNGDYYPNYFYYLNMIDFDNYLSWWQSYSNIIYQYWQQVATDPYYNINYSNTNGVVFIIDANSMQIVKIINTGKGAGHVAFSKQKGIAIVTNHLDNYLTAIDYKNMTFLKNIYLPFPSINIASLKQSHMQHVSEDGKYYYNFWSDGGYFFRVDLDTLEVDKSIEVDGVPIQGNFYKHISQNCNIPAPAPDDGYDDFFSNSSSGGKVKTIQTVGKTKAKSSYIERNSKESSKDHNDYDK